ncbi:MAG: Imm32 family immunity protein [Candidatus Acidiferrales bacterium]
MSGPREVLPEKGAEILAPGSRLKFTLNDRQELEIFGNSKGLKALAAICSGLSESTDCNHYHLDQDFWGTEPGSIPVTISRQEQL